MVKVVMLIYKTTNLINGKIYIGQDSKNNPEYLGSGLLISHAIKKYGKDNFKKEILEFCNDKKTLDEKEKYWINYFSSTDTKIGYNISRGGTGGKLVDNDPKKGKTYEEYYGQEKASKLKAYFSKIRKGKQLKYKNITSEEVGKKISTALKGRKLTDKHKDSVSNGVKKFFKTDDGIKLKNKLSEIRKGVPLSEKTRKKQSESLKGKRPKVLDVHPSAKYWFFYNKENELILEILGNKTKTLKELGTNQRRVVIFTDLNDCLSYTLEPNKDYKIFTKKYYV